MKIELIFSAIFLREIAQLGAIALLLKILKISSWLIFILVFSQASMLFAFPPPRPGTVYRNEGGVNNREYPLLKRGAFVFKPRKKINLEKTGKSVSINNGSLMGTLSIDSSQQSIRPIVFLIDFSDKVADRTIHAPEDYEKLFFDVADPTVNSVGEYWTEVSYGTFTVTGSLTDIQGWLRPGVDFFDEDGNLLTVTLNSELTDLSFGLNNTNFEILLGDLIAFLDPSVDFSIYDADGDSIVDSAIFVHSGWGAEDSSDIANDILSQTIDLINEISVDGVTFSDITLVPEEKFYNDPDFLSSGVVDQGNNNGNEEIIGIGLIAHEMGHLLGLPDLYPTGGGEQPSGDFSGVGVFDLMGFGFWGSPQLAFDINQTPPVPSSAVALDNPAHLSAWSKIDLGWIDPVEISSDILNPGLDFVIPPVEIVSPTVLKVFINGKLEDPDQYILVENRQTGTGSLFDNSLPGSGILIWHIDESVISAKRPVNLVNTDPDSKGIDVEEADGFRNLDQSPSGAINYGGSGDFFSSGSSDFDRNNPSLDSNSIPIVSDDHPTDNGIDVSLTNFDLSGNDVSFNLKIVSHNWKTFDTTTTASFTGDPLTTDDIQVIGQDSANAIWFGTVDSGIWRLSGTNFEKFSTQQGLPSNNINAFAFDSRTGVMWVGTDNGIARMRNRGSGFELVPDNPFLTGSAVNDLAIDSEGFLWAATNGSLSLIDDGGTDSISDDFVGSIKQPGIFTAVAVSLGGNRDPVFDVVFAYDNSGKVLYRSSDGRNVNEFVELTKLPPNLDVNDLAIDSKGFIWVATDLNGLLVYDDKLTVTVSDDELDPLDINNNSITDETVFITTLQSISSNRVTGVTFQNLEGQGEVIAYFSHRNDGVNEGGATRVDLNVDPADRFSLGFGLTVYRNDPLDETVGPASNTIRGDFTDQSGNVWFPTNRGSSRFGNAGILTLDATTYFNYSAIASVSLEDDGLNNDPTVQNLARVSVVSQTDPDGFVLDLLETDVDTGIFTGTFGFTEGITDTTGEIKLLHIEQNNRVTVTYQDASPPGDRVANALWKRIFPFKDDLFIEGCFIATAAFGSNSSPIVLVFRKFRDDHLLGRSLGRKFVSAYYRCSPLLAGIINQHETARFIVRSSLAPFALFINVLFEVDLMGKLYLVIFIFGVLATFRWAKGRVR